MRIDSVALTPSTLLLTGQIVLPSYTYCTHIYRRTHTPPRSQLQLPGRPPYQGSDPGGLGLFFNPPSARPPQINHPPTRSASPSKARRDGSCRTAVPTRAEPLTTTVIPPSVQPGRHIRGQKHPAAQRITHICLILQKESVERNRLCKDLTEFTVYEPSC